MLDDKEIGYAEKAWSEFKAGDFELSLKYLSKVWAYDYFGFSDGYSPDNDNLKKFIDTGLFLLQFKHPFRFEEYELEKLFAESIARKWFGGDLHMASAPFELSKWFGKEDPLAFILGADVTTQLRVEDILDNLNDLGMANPIESLGLVELTYSEVVQRWPELLKLRTLSLPARKAFIAIIKKTQLSSNLVEYGSLEYSAINSMCRSISKEGSSIFVEAIQPLIHEGLAVDVISPSELLMNISLKRLEQFAFDNNIRAHGVKKKIVSLISSSASSEKISDFLLDNGVSGRYLKPIVVDFPGLKKYVWAKSMWLDKYMEWVVSAQHIQLKPSLEKKQTRKKLLEPHVNPVKKAKKSERSSLFPRRYREKNIGGPFGHLGDISAKEIALVESIWDSNCDEIIKGLHSKYGWFASYYYSDAIEHYVSSSSVTVINNAREADPENVASWPNIIPSYTKLRLECLNVVPKDLKSLICNNCKKEFDEASVHYSCVKRVGCKICFCTNCYQAAFMYSGDFLKISSEQILEIILEFVTAFESIPRVRDIDTPNLSNISSDKQIAIVKALLRMPPLKQIKSEFGSWLNALVLAGVLPDGTKKEARGIRCVANDGHECLSLGEKSIDDWLSGHNIPHDKEPYYPYHSEYNTTGRMRADWVVGDIFIEYAGLMNNPSYFSKMNTKREIANLFGIPLIVIEPKDILNLDGILGSLINNEAH